MTENEAKAIKWMKNIKDHAVVTLDHIKNVGICLIIRSSFRKKGTKEMLDMDNYIGLTADELQGIVDNTCIVRKEGVT